MISDSDIDDGNETSYNEDSCKNLKVLRERIAKLEKENHRLKAQLGVYEMTGKRQFSFLFPILLMFFLFFFQTTCCHFAQTNKRNIYAAGQLFTPKVTEGERKVGKI